MGTVGRDDPCPCGSGRKYKYCCGTTNIIPFPKPADAEPGPGAPRFRFPDLNNPAEDLSPETSLAAAEDFLGLSLDQMEEILWSHFDEWDELVSLEPEVSPQDVESIPILERAVYLLRRVRELEPLKATKNGNMPQKMVREMYDLFRDPPWQPEWRFRSEADWSPFHSLRVRLEMAGLLKKRNNQFSLTRAATRILERQDFTELYKQLLEIHITQYNWAFADAYPETPLLQQLALFGLYLLHVEADDGINANELGELVLRAVPYAVEQIEPTTYSTPEERVKECFRIRFLDRFAVPFGFATAETNEWGLSRPDTRYQTTALFRKFLIWRI